MKTQKFSIILVIGFIVICTTFCLADDFDWPRWRGPNGNGISMETDWNPEALAEGPKILWKADVGKGHSNVIIKENRLYTMGIKEIENVIICLNAETGEEIWKYAYRDVQDPQSTPTLDGKYIYVLSKVGELICLREKDGKVRWQHNIVEKYDVLIPFYGFAGSPVIEGNLLILTANNFGLALDKKTGRKIWISEKAPEDLRVKNSTGPHYATPVVHGYEGKRCAVITSYVGVYSVEVETGEVLWLYKWDSFRDTQVADPLVFNNKVFITQYWKTNGCVLLDIEKGEPKVLWENKNMHSNISTPVLIDGYIYGVRGGPDQGFYSILCLKVETGEVMWEEGMDVLTKSVSLMAADGKLIILEDDGTLHIAEVTSTSYKEISSCDVLEGEQKFRRFWTPPVLCNGRIYCRNYDGDLVCIDVSK